MYDNKLVSCYSTGKGYRNRIGNSIPQSLTHREIGFLRGAITLNAAIQSWPVTILSAMETKSLKVGDTMIINICIFAVTDLDAVLERVSQAGGEIIAGIQKMPWGERIFYAKDPFGNPISFVDQETVFLGSSTNTS